MIIKTNIITDMVIDSLEDLCKLKPFLEDSTLKINKSQIARELKVNRKTVEKYLNGFEKLATRNKPNSLMNYLEIIEELLSEQNTQMFYYKRILWQYLKDNHQYNGSYNNFVRNLKKYPHLDDYFNKQRPCNTNQVNLRYETGMAHQAQIDWKESIDFKLVSGENITIHLFVYLLFYSRFRLYQLSMSKVQRHLVFFFGSCI